MPARPTYTEADIVRDKLKFLPSPNLYLRRLIAHDAHFSQDYQTYNKSYITELRRCGAVQRRIRETNLLERGMNGRGRGGGGVAISFLVIEEKNKKNM